MVENILKVFSAGTRVFAHKWRPNEWHHTSFGAIFQYKFDGDVQLVFEVTMYGNNGKHMYKCYPSSGAIFQYKFDGDV